MGGRCFIDKYVNLPITRDTLNFFICVYKNNDNDNFKKDTPSYLEYSLIHQWVKFSLCILWTLEKIINSRLTYISMFIKNMTIRSLKASHHVHWGKHVLQNYSSVTLFRNFAFIKGCLDEDCGSTWYCIELVSKIYAKSKQDVKMYMFIYIVEYFSLGTWVPFISERSV